MTKPFRQASYNQHALHVLEYDRVREIVADLADSDEGRLCLSSLSPYSNVEDVREILAEVEEFMEAIRFDDSLPDLSVHSVSDFFPRLKVKGYNLGIENIVAVADNLETTRLVRKYFEGKNEKYPSAWNIVVALSLHEDLEKHIRKTITPDLTIADEASSELRSIRRKLTRAKSSLRNLVEKTLAELSEDITSERIITIRNGRFVIPVHEYMKKRVPGAVHDRSQTGKTLFIEPLASIEGNNLVCELEMAERAEIVRILIELTARIAVVADAISQNQDTLIRLDVIKAKARFGVMLDGVIPTISDEPLVCIKKGRHPLLAWKYRKKGEGASVIPLDIDVGDSYVTVVITGPNAGGKTVAIKTVGLLTVMALSGLPVPAASGTSLFLPSGIFADIGDEQSVEDDLSTFSSHMKQIVTILREAGPGSLVLLDELGGGTNPSDGEAIALAVLKKLTGIRTVTIATTHHEGLKVFAHETEGVINASMEFDKKNLRPAYSLRKGVPGSSYAFDIAARMGMPEDILNEAVLLTGNERKSLEGLITEMEEHLRQADKERLAATTERKELEAVREEYEQKLDEITKRKNELLSEAITESQKLVKDANRLIESTVKSIREKKASSEAIKESKSRVSDLEEELKHVRARIPKKKKKVDRKRVRKLTEESLVWVDSLGSTAAVEEVLDGGKRARIRVGKSKASIIVNASDLFENGISKKKDKQVVRVSAKSTGITTNEIDLRGMIFDEAHEALDSFLDRLYVSGIETAHIIHGKGTGALRKKIKAYLDKHASVDSYRLGNWNEGGAGVSVVTLKK
ncbi:MAG: endonuclease MutS2 [Candidatus Latescibacteria bacterium]|jgi:DNA mismatch repair protein MutS2|nr:endonuclease MutS2 [Candidatus Latescibacterota bacterium]